MDKDEQIKQLTALVEMFKQRDNVYLQHTTAIFELLAPCLLQAIIEFFDINQQQVEWHEVKLYNTTLIILSTLHLDPPPEIVDQLSPEELQDLYNTELRKIIRVAIPANLIFADKQTIIDWLEKQDVQHVENMMAALQGQEQEDEPVESEATQEPDQPDRPEKQQEFDVASLSRDQIAQLLLFQHTSTKGTKQ